MKKIAILGSTGSIGTQTLDVVEHHADKFSVEALAAGHNLDLLIQQTRKFQPKKVSLATAELAEKAKTLVPQGTEVYYGEAGLEEIAGRNDATIVVSAIVGSQGLKPTLFALESGKDVALANKEALVCAGHLVTEKVRQYGVSLYPVDSEHSAIFQCLNGEKTAQVEKLILTASGGSFRDKSRSELEQVTVEEALAHPNWSMGSKVTIDSATMANKGLEVIEAHWLFNLPYEQIEVVIHPESIIHSMVQYVDRSVVAQLGLPDMRVPIQYALTYPDRLETTVPSLNLAELGKLHFRKMDFERFPCIKLAFDSGKAGGTATTVFNAANEIAVERFIQGEIKFLQIENIVDHVLQRHQTIRYPDLESVLEADAWARKEASRLT